MQNPRLDEQTGGAQRVLVLGAGFAGLSAARQLAEGVRRGAPIEVTLIDRNNYHVFSPLLYQAAVGLVDSRSVAYPVRAILHGTETHFLRAEVERVDLGGRCVETTEGRVDFDWLILALGSVPRFYGLHDPERRVIPLKTIEDANAIRAHVIGAFEEAEQLDDPDLRRQALKFTIVGGGPTGLELAGALRALITDVAGQEYRRFRPEDASVTVLEGASQVLSGLPEALTRVARDRLEQRGVAIRLGERIRAVDAEGVETTEGVRYPTGRVIWAAGVQPNPLADDLSGRRLSDGRLEVRATLQFEGNDRVFVVGDCAGFTAPGAERPLGALAPVAMQQGATAARNVLRAVAGRPMRGFHYRDRGNLVILGRYAAVAQLGAIELDGLAAWLLWRAVHLAWLPGLRNQLQVLVDWSLLTSTPRQTSHFEVDPRAAQVRAAPPR